LAAPCGELPSPLGIEVCDAAGLLFVPFPADCFFPEPDPEHA
jgi:hypothetical protein